MAITKNAWIRYRTLDRCFSNPGRKYYIQDLLEEIRTALQDYDPNARGIQRRQLYYDIDFMMSANGFDAPIEKYTDGRKAYYRYEDPAFSIQNQPINEYEANQIKSALLILSRFSGTEQFNWVNELIPKLEQAFGLKENTQDLIGFESNIFLTGLEYIEPLFNAIYNERVLKITYKPFHREEPWTVIFHPYYLKQYNNRWFLFGLNNADCQKPRIMNLALDRIQQIEETDTMYFPNNIFTPVDYFEDIIGVSRTDEDLIHIELLFSLNRAPYVLTKPIHGSQTKLQLDDKGLLISIDVIPNNELDALILSYGENVKVISPRSYQERIAEKLQIAISNYKII